MIQPFKAAATTTCLFHSVDASGKLTSFIKGILHLRIQAVRKTFLVVSLFFLTLEPPACRQHQPALLLHVVHFTAQQWLLAAAVHHRPLIRTFGGFGTCSLVYGPVQCDIAFSLHTMMTTTALGEHAMIVYQ